MLQDDEEDPKNTPVQARPPLAVFSICDNSGDSLSVGNLGLCSLPKPYHTPAVTAENHRAKLSGGEMDDITGAGHPTPLVSYMKKGSLDLSVTFLNISV
ncbi:hypothetical protein WISP_141712 [Willisornis vidua]|uniref:Uncharacterized protein n=1 Tax=Willisornis vidua TaxID=1566151 RepID=A0ABQ9CRZ7_9PASS|nr:hypothetical protein WISP_141712 [Willisornis vidua]